MKKLMVRGGIPLRGKIEISGAKNSAVALIPAALLADSTVALDHMPCIDDVRVYREILEELGVGWSWQGETLVLDPQGIAPKPLPNGHVKKLRASYYLMGALLGRFGEAVVGLPGGCDLGPRPIDQHIKGFEALGAEIKMVSGTLHMRAERLRGTRIYLDVVSVGATINIMLAAACAEGMTVIENAAKEPEIVDVSTLLNSMGAKVSGAGTDVIRVEGVRELHGCRHSIIPDRIEAGTFLIATAITGGDVWLDNVIPKHLEPIIAKLKEVGLTIEEAEDSLHITGSDRSGFHRVDLKTLPYPGFPTDLQQPMTSLMTQVQGASMITDNIYASRFRHIEELKRMGASIMLEGRTAIVEGHTPLQGAKVHASDLRAGAALIVAALAAEGVTEISGVEHIDRGYETLEQKLQQLGAMTWRMEE